MVMVVYGDAFRIRGLEEGGEELIFFANQVVNSEEGNLKAYPSFLVLALQRQSRMVPR
jgi:hypothetical protein